MVSHLPVMGVAGGLCDPDCWIGRGSAVAAAVSSLCGSAAKS